MSVLAEIRTTPQPRSSWNRERGARGIGAGSIDLETQGIREVSGRLTV